ncbi:MAG: hypothetical protein JW700_03215 [Candidatus Aenigmarchaeota archaeon]|nr:hypothetical protein [Candidatus Aenigmarchaeota archaeon]
MKLFGNRLKGSSGVAIGAMVVLTLAFIVASVSYMMPVLAAHDALVTITPNKASCSDLPSTFNVNVENVGNGGYGIYNVKIYKAMTNIVSLTCGPAPSGWTLVGGGLQFGSYCEYTTDPYIGGVIDYGEELDFTFDAVIDQDNCQSTFRVTTLDNQAIVTGSGQGEEENHDKVLNVDCTPPVIEKQITSGTFDERDGVCPPGLQEEGDVCWMTQGTIHVTATDSSCNDECNLGLAYCEWDYTVDGVPEDSGNETANTCVEGWDIVFDEDSEHILTITCYDVVGNSVEDVETFKVDDTPPTTTKDIEPDEYVRDGAEYIDTVNEITFTNPDGGDICAIGTDKTWYKNVVYTEEVLRTINNDGPHGYDYCYQPDMYCNGAYLGTTTPYESGVECINEAQEHCNDNVVEGCDGLDCQRWEADGYDNWERCVESYVYGNCNVDSSWKLYDGTPITKDQESCHVLYYFSIDELGNVEDMQYNCFFVDKTPPELSKEVGDPKLQFCDMTEEPEVLTEADLSNDVFGVTVTKSSDGTKVKWVVDFDETDMEGHTATGAQVMIASESVPLFNIGMMQDGGNWFAGYKPYDGSWGAATNVLPDGMTVTGSPNSEYYEIEIPIESLPCPYYWAINVEATCPGCDGFPGSSSAQQNYPEDWSRWTAVNTALGPQTNNFWVTDETDITFTCRDPEPHPSGDEEVCFKVSYDMEQDGYNTDVYCAKYSGTMEGDWCCIDSTPQTPFVFNFNAEEYSLHDLEYYCRDAVGKESEPKIQYYKVYAVPEVSKEMADDAVYIGDCLPGTEPSDDECYVKSGNVVEITFSEPQANGCLLPIECTYEVKYQNEIVDFGDFNDDITIPMSGDCEHILTIECVDAIGNTAFHDVETFEVDETPPETTKTYGDPTVVDGDYRWITSATPITLTSEDEKVGVDGIYYTYEWVSDEMCEAHPENSKTDEYQYLPSSGNYVFPSTNEDNKNGENVYRPGVIGPHVNLVSAGLGEVTLQFVNPNKYLACFEYMTDGGDPSQIQVDENYHPDVTDMYPYVCLTNDVTEMIIPASEFVEVRSIFGGERDWDFDWTRFYVMQDTSSWNFVADDIVEFNIPDDSCHVIKYMAVDLLGNMEGLNVQYVMVDNQPPEPTKIVGEPKDIWTPGQNGDPESYWYPEETANCWTGEEGEIECWEVTTLTPISMECTDPQPHPVDHESVCFKIDVDGCDETERYCGRTIPDKGGPICLFGINGCGDFNMFEYNEETGYCCADQEITDFYFKEDTEHNLKYYCVDALGNEGPIDEEKFKVEGTKFEVPLYKKWNLVSVPFVLLDDSPDSVFSKLQWDGVSIDDMEGVELGDLVDSVWTYDPDDGICDEEWCWWKPGVAESTLDSIRPGWGYWVLVTDKPNGCEEEDDMILRPMCSFYKQENEQPLWLVMGGSLFSAATTPPSRELQEGWNLVGYYGTNWDEYDWSDFDFMCGEEYGHSWDKYLYGDQAYCALNTLVDTQEGYPEWSSLWSYVNCGNHNTDWLGINACIQESECQAQDRMYAGRGYWLFMREDGTYAPATTCIWNTDFECVWTGLN